MPTILRIDGHRFFFYSRETHEPPHIHVQTAEKAAKFWLNPVTLARSVGYNQSELGRLYELVEQNQALLLEKWYEYFSATNI
jgi:hypothetical protein